MSSRPHTHTHTHTHTIIRPHTHTALGQTAAKEFFWVELFMQLSRPAGVSCVCLCVCVCVCVHVHASACVRVCVRGKRENHRMLQCVFTLLCLCVWICDVRLCPCGRWRSPLGPGCVPAPSFDATTNICCLMSPSLFSLSDLVFLTPLVFHLSAPSLSIPLWPSFFFLWETNKGAVVFTLH